MNDKYYYGIDMSNGLSYCVESDISSVREWMNTWINKEWYQFNHKSDWKNGKEDTDIIQFNSVIVRVKDVVNVCCCVPIPE